MASLNQLSEFTSNIIAPKGKASKDIMEDIRQNRTIAKNTFTGNRILVTSEKGVSDSSEFSHNQLNHLDGILSPIQTQINDIKSTISDDIPKIVDIHSKNLIKNVSDIENQVSSHLSSVTLDNISDGSNNKFIVNDTIHGDINVTGRITANNLEVTDTYIKYATDKYVADNIIVNDGNQPIVDSSQLQSGSALTLTQNGLQNILEVYSQNTTTKNHLTIKQNGRVGMGTVSPAEILDIQGDMQFSGTVNGITNNEFNSLANTSGNLQEQINTLSSGFVGNNNSIDLTNQITSNIVTTVKNNVTQQITISSNNAIHYYQNICENKQDNITFGNGLSLVNDTLELTANITTAWTDSGSNYISYGNVHVYSDKIIIGDNTNVAPEGVTSVPAVTYKYPRDGVSTRSQSSTNITNYHSGRAFDGATTGIFIWITQIQTYQNGQYPADGQYYINPNYRGEWIMIDLGEEAIINEIKLYGRSGGDAPRHPRNYRIYGSNDEQDYINKVSDNWTLIFEKINDTPDTSPSTYPSVESFPQNTSPYRYYVLVINKVYSGNQYAEILEWELYGNEPNAVVQNTSTPVFGDTTTDMVAWYKFEGDFTDSSGNGYDLTPNLKTPQFINNSKYGNNSVWFEGNTQWNSTPNKAGLFLDNLSNKLSSHINTSITISLWVYTLGKGQINYGHIFSGITSDNYRSDNEFKIFYQNNTEKLGFVSNDIYENYIDVTSDGGEPFLNRWVHIVWILDSTNTSIYIDGVKKIDRTDYRFPTITDTYTFTIGAWNVNNPNTGGARDINGYLDDFRIYKRVLTEEEVSELYNYVPGAVQSSLPDNQVATLDMLDNKQTSLRWGGIYRMLFKNFQSDVLVLTDQYGKVNESSVSTNNLNKLSDARSDINNQINSLSNTHQSSRNNLQSANDTWNTNTSNYIKNTVQTTMDSITATKLSTDVVFSTGFVQDGNNISLDTEMTISSEAVNNTSSTYWDLHYKYGSNIPPEIVSNSTQNTSSGSSFGDKTDDMIAWYKFEDIDNPGLDSSGNNNDMSGYTGANLGNSSSLISENNNKYGDYSFYKTSTSDSLRLIKDVPILSSVFTISFWIFNIQQTGTQTYIATRKRRTTGFNGFLIYKSSSAFLSIGIISRETDVSSLNVSIPWGDVDNNSWNHIVYNIDTASKEINAYLNGVLYLNAIDTNANIDLSLIIEESFEIAFGAQATGAYNYYYSNADSFYMDDVRIYNRVLTADEVNKLYTYDPNAVVQNTGGGGGAVVSSSFGNDTTDMLVWYQLDGDTTDSSGNGNDLNITHAISEQYDSSIKKFGSSSINFNSKLYGSASNDDILYFTPPSITISTWIYNAQIHTSHQGIASARYYQSGGYGWVLYIMPNTGQLSLWIGEGPGRYWNDVRFDFSINEIDTEWTHIAVILDVNVRKLYINNVFVSEKTISNTIYYGGGFNLGSTSNGEFPLKTGTKLDDFRLYNRALTESELSDLYTYDPNAVVQNTGGGGNLVSLEKYPRELFSENQNTLTYEDGITVSVKATSTLFGIWVAGNLFSGTSGGTNQTKLFATYSNYVTTTGIAKGNTTNGYRAGYDGDYVIIDLGETIYLNNFKLYQKQINSFPQHPTVFRLFASNDVNVFDETDKTLAANHSSWVQIFDKSNDDDWVNGDQWIISPAATTSYRYYMIIFNKISPGTNGYLVLDMLEFYGAEEFMIETQQRVPFYTDTQNLMLWYKFDKDNFTTNSGNLGSAYDVTQNSALADSSIRIKGDSAANLDGSYMIIQSDLDFTANNVISICFWTKITQLNSQWDVVLYKYMSASNAIIIQRNGSTNYWSIQFGAAHATTDGFLNDFSLDDTNWRHYCFTFVKTDNNVTIKIFKNGAEEPVFTQEITNTWPSIPIGKVTIGDHAYPLRHYIDDLRFYDRELIAAELNQLYIYEPPVVDYITYKNTSGVTPDKYLKYYPDKLTMTYNLENISNTSIIHDDVVSEPTSIPGSGGYKYFAFTSTTGTNSITFDRDTVCDVLVVGGGGGGGWSLAGGGGAGSVIHIINENIPSGKYDITIGNGGNGGTSSSSAGKGGNTIISKLGYNTVIAEGGGGGTQGTVGNSGGSGSGTMAGIYSGGAVGTESTTGIFTGVIYGNKGGNITTNRVGDPFGGSGGGGAGSPAQNIRTSSGSPEDQGNGGDGIQINIDGNNYYWGGGGGGTGHVKKGGDGGKGGGGGGATGYFDYTAQGGGDAINSGGNGGKGGGTKGGDGGANTGGGGGASTWISGGGAAAGGKGGSGIVIIRWYSPDAEYPITEVDELVSKQDALYFGNGLKYNSTTKELTAGGWKNKKTNISHGDVSFATNTLSLYKGERINTYTAFQPSRKYPDIFLNGATSISPYTSQNHVVQWSSEEATANYRGHQLFNGDRADVGWISADNKYYNDSDTIPTGSVVGDAIDQTSYIGDDSDNYGEWVKIELDKAIYLSYIKIYERRITGWSFRNPAFYVIYGSNDGNTWTQLIVNKTNQATYTTDTDRVHTSEQVVPSQNYKHFAITVTKTTGGLYGDCGFSELEFYGNEHINVKTSISSSTSSINPSKLGSIETNNVITKNISSIDSEPIKLGKHIEIHNLTDTLSNPHMMMSSNITSLSSDEKSYCMRIKRNIWIDGADIVWTSDERIKKDIQDIDDDGALQKILAIEPKTYKYIDHLERGKNKVYGFISQQVKDVIPEATTQTNKYIPNIYKYCPYFGKTIVLPDDFDISTIVSTYNGKMLSDKLRLISSNGEATDVLFVLNGNTNTNTRYTMTISGKIPGDGRDVFVYGTEIEDMTTIDKSYIYTLNVCATQTLSRKTDLIDVNSSNLLLRTSELEQRIADIESKMSN